VILFQTLQCRKSVITDRATRRIRFRAAATRVCPRAELLSTPSRRRVFISGVARINAV